MTDKRISDAGQAHVDLITGGASLDVLDAVDRDTLYRYCEAYAHWEDAERKIAEHGILVKAQTGFPSESPYMAVAHRYSMACSRMESGVKRVLGELKEAAKREQLRPENDDDLDQLLGAGLRVV